MNKKQSVLVASASALSLVALAALSINALSVAAYGSEEALEDSEYTIEEMLTYAIQDEYLALAEYDAIIDTFGAIRPFTKIMVAEQTHVDLLLPLFEAYDIEVVPNTASELVIIPSSIEEALATGVTAEINNIAMYDAFLSQDLPDDIENVFNLLKNASEKHLAAFSKTRVPNTSIVPPTDVEDPVDPVLDPEVPSEPVAPTCVPVGIGPKGPKTPWRR